jgi:predicted nucleic acid-binding protein
MTNGLWVIDASVLAKVYLKDEEFAPLAHELVRRYVDGSVELIAPQFIQYEIPSAIQAAVRRRRLDSSDARQAIRDFFNLRIRTLGDADTLHLMIESAYMRATQLGCRMHDALYLVVAEVVKCQFITADSKLYEAIRDKVDYVVWIEDYAESIGDASP